MATRKLILTGSVQVGRGKDASIMIGAGTDVTEVTLPDKEYGLSNDDVKRIVDSGAGCIETEATKPKQEK